MSCWSSASVCGDELLDAPGPGPDLLKPATRDTRSLLKATVRSQEQGSSATDPAGCPAEGPSAPAGSPAGSA